jgi:ubiquinol-cytochrome c reductase cytochrome c subunit
MTMKTGRIAAAGGSRLALMVTLCALARLAAAQPAADAIEAGRQLFMANGCYSCHGTVGQGGERSAAPKLAPDPYPFETFRALVRSPREAMPRFDPRYLSDEQLRAIHGYLASIRKGPSARDIPQLATLAR